MCTGLPVAALPVSLGCPNLSGRPTFSTCYAFEGASRSARLVTTERLLQGCPKIAPPSTSPLVSTPGAIRSSCLVRPVPSARRSQRPARSVPVGSHHLDGFLHQQLAGLLHPAADHGVHRVSAACRASADWRTSSCFPSDATPFRAFPTRTAASTSPRTVALLPLRGASCFQGPLDFKALLHTSVRCVRHRCR